MNKKDRERNEALVKAARSAGKTKRFWRLMMLEYAPELSELELEELEALVFGEVTVA